MLGELIAETNVVCIVTVSKQLFTAIEMARMRHLVDTVISLETYAASDLSFFAKEYTGSIQLVKALRVNRLVYPRRFVQGKRVGIDKCYGFKCRKKKFVIEKLCLPPDLGGDKVDTEAKKQAQSGCSQTW